MSLLVVEDINKRFQENAILKSVNFRLEGSGKLAIAGATGSGKTSLLKIVAGLMQPTSGQVLFNNESVKGPDETLLPGHAGITYLSQHFELRNNYKVFELLQMSSKMNKDQLAIICSICKIDHLLHRWTNQLSGGERQRISLAMALVTSPKLLLLDEPYSNLDAIHKSILKEVLSNITEQLHITTVIVSHDPLDILSWADSILILDRGSIIQQASPQEIYHQPTNEYVAALFGKYNKLTPALAEALGTSKQIIRPSEIILSQVSGNGIKGVVERVDFMGNNYEITVKVDGCSLLVNSPDKLETSKDVSIQLH